MNLYAIEHPDGGKWWSSNEREWVDSPWGYGGVLVESEAALSENFGGLFTSMMEDSGGGTVVTFALTRMPELREGARVVYREDVMEVCGIDGVYVDLGPMNGAGLIDDLIVLPDGFYQPPQKSPDEVEP